MPLSLLFSKPRRRAASSRPAPHVTALKWTFFTLLLGCCAGVGTCARAQSPAATAATLNNSNNLVLQARELLSARKDKTQPARFAQIRQAVQGHPLAQWVEYWELNNRLAEAQPAELTEFFTRWPGTYVEDRLRNDWLLELGRRRDWATLRAELPQFRMNDDREVACYGLLAQHLEGQDVRQAARSAWHALRETGEGCWLLGQTLVQSGALTKADAWQALRVAVEGNRPRAARAAADAISPAVEAALTTLWENPARFLARRRAQESVTGFELDLLALMRAAATDPDYAATQLEGAWANRLPATAAATAWAHVAKQSAQKQLPAAADQARRAWQLWDRANKPGVQPPWSDELLAWHVRAALREGGDKPDRWRLVLRALDAMPEQAFAAGKLPAPAWSPGRSDDREGTWVYWKATATLALHKPGAATDAARSGETARAQARQALQALATQHGFYGQLAAADLRLPFVLPPAPAAPTPEESAAARAHPGFDRALQLINLGLRAEGVREWNYSLKGMDTRQLLAAAQWACDQAVWDRCINTSERTRDAVHIAQRFPMPLQDAMLAAAKEAALDPAVLLGLVRQESRFITDVRSHVGASGLMQLMPATARWTAKKVGLDFKPEMINDPAVNLRLGATYLKRLVDDFDGSLPLATAAYNAGPGRPRRWREGPPLEPAAWAETIPFNETRDYVKKVLANAVVYNALLGLPPVGIHTRLGRAIGPRDPAAPATDKDLP